MRTQKPHKIRDMFNISALSNTDPALDISRLLRVFEHAVAYAETNDGIGLTKSGAFNHKFCHWLAETYDWSEHSADHLLRIQKVLNEDDVLPALIAHELCAELKLGRHVKGKFQFMKPGLAKIEDRGQFFADLARYYLFQYIWPYREPVAAPGNWDVYINVLNIEAEKSGVTCSDMLKVYYGFEASERFDSPEARSHFRYVKFEILDRLYWLGLLDRTKKSDDWSFEAVYTKTDLWRAALELDPIPDFIKSKAH